MNAMIGKYKLHIIWALVAVVALVGGIFWGKAMGTSARGALAGNFSASSTRSFAGRTGAASGGIYAGQVSAVGSSSLTLQLSNGNSEVVFYSTSTPVTEPQVVSPSKLTTGTNVVITGTANSDGSVTASSIQVGNAAGGFRGGAGGTQGQSSATAQ